MTNYFHYRSYPSMVTQQPLPTTGITFPRIVICSHSMHSKRKLLAKYHGLDLSYIEELYGLGPNNLLTQKVYNNWTNSRVKEYTVYQGSESDHL